MIEEPAFALDAAAVSSKRTIRTDNAVARNYDSYGVIAVGCAHRPDRSGVTDAACEFAVRGNGATRDVAQFVPDFELEGSAPGGDGDCVDSG